MLHSPFVPEFLTSNSSLSKHPRRCRSDYFFQTKRRCMAQIHLWLFFDGHITSRTKHLNENSTTQHSSCRHWSLIVNICRDNAVQDLTLASMVKAPLTSKRGRKGGTFVGEYIVIDDATRIWLPTKTGYFLLHLGFSAWFRQRSLNQLQISFVQCISERLFLKYDSLFEKCCV